MNHFKKAILILSLFSLILLSPNRSFAVNPAAECKNLSDSEIEQIVTNLEKDSTYISQLTDCQSKDYQLFARLMEVNSHYFEYADESIRGDVTFVKNFVKKYPDILDYIAPKLKSDPEFFKSIAGRYNKALEYASDDLLDNREFMEDMINLRPKNFMYASERLQNDFSFVSSAVEKDGLVLRYASQEMRENKLIVLKAIKSNVLASTYISPKLQSDREVKKLTKNHDYSFLINIESFLRNNYAGIEVGPNGSRGYHIVNQALFLKQKPTIDRNDFFTWRLWEGDAENNVKLSTGRIRNLSWLTDLRDYPELTAGIQKFLYEKLDENTANSMTLTSLWVIPSNPDLIIFKMYLLRHVGNLYSATSINNTSYVVGVAYNKTIREEAPKEDQTKKDKDKMADNTKADQKDVTKDDKKDTTATAQAAKDPVKDAAAPKQTAKTEASKEAPKQDMSAAKAIPAPDSKKEEAPKSAEQLKAEIKGKIQATAKTTDQEVKTTDQEVAKTKKEKPAKKDDWVVTIIDSDMDVDLDNNIILRNNHQEYEFWDIYQNGKDKTSNLIFKVKDKNSEYFEIFSKQPDDKYKSIFTGGGYSFEY